MAGQGYRRNLTKIDPKGKGSESQQSLDYSTRDQSESGCTHCGEISWMNDNPSRKRGHPESCTSCDSFSRSHIDYTRVADSSRKEDSTFHNFIYSSKKRASGGLYQGEAPDRPYSLSQDPAAGLLSPLACPEDVFSEGSWTTKDVEYDGYVQSKRERSPTPATVLQPLGSSPGRRVVGQAPLSDDYTWVVDPESANVLRALCISERSSPFDVNYLATCHGPSMSAAYLDASMRRITVSWMVEVVAEFRLSQDTLHVAIAAFDRFLSCTRGVPRSALQLLAVGCLLVASKHEEEAHPCVKDLTSIANHSFTTSDLLRMEALILGAISFQLASPTPHTFLLALRGALGLPSEVFSMAAYLIELAALEYSMLAIPRSGIAAGAVTLAALCHGEAGISPALVNILPGDANQINECVHKLLLIHNGAVADFNAWRSAKKPKLSLYMPINEKFSAKEWDSVSLVPAYNLHY